MTKLLAIFSIFLLTNFSEAPKEDLPEFECDQFPAEQGCTSWKEEWACVVDNCSTKEGEIDDGIWTIKFDTEKHPLAMKGEVKDGHPFGLWQRYYITNELFSEKEFDEKGNTTKVTKYYKDGRKKYFILFDKNHKASKEIRWNIKGEIIMKR